MKEAVDGALDGAFESLDGDLGVGVFIDGVAMTITTRVRLIEAASVLGNLLKKIIGLMKIVRGSDAGVLVSSVFETSEHCNAS